MQAASCDTCSAQVQLDAADLSESGPACSCLEGRSMWLLQQGPGTTGAEGSLGAPGGTGLNLQTAERSLGAVWGTCLSIADTVQLHAGVTLVLQDSGPATQQHQAYLPGH